MCTPKDILQRIETNLAGLGEDSSLMTHSVLNSEEPGINNTDDQRKQLRDKALPQTSKYVELAKYLYTTTQTNRSRSQQWPENSPIVNTRAYSFDNLHYIIANLDTLSDLPCNIYRNNTDLDLTVTQEESNHAFQFLNNELDKFGERIRFDEEKFEPCKKGDMNDELINEIIDIINSADVVKNSQIVDGLLFKQQLEMYEANVGLTCKAHVESALNTMHGIEMQYKHRDATLSSNSIEDISKDKNVISADKICAPASRVKRGKNHDQTDVETATSNQPAIISHSKASDIKTDSDQQIISDQVTTRSLNTIINQSTISHQKTITYQITSDRDIISDFVEDIIQQAISELISDLSDQKTITDHPTMSDQKKITGHQTISDQKTITDHLAISDRNEIYDQEINNDHKIIRDQKLIRDHDVEGDEKVTRDQETTNDQTATSNHIGTIVQQIISDSVGTSDQKTVSDRTSNSQPNGISDQMIIIDQKTTSDSKIISDQDLTSDQKIISDHPSISDQTIIIDQKTTSDPNTIADQDLTNDHKTISNHKTINDQFIISDQDVISDTNSDKNTINDQVKDLYVNEPAIRLEDYVQTSFIYDQKSDILKQSTLDAISRVLESFQIEEPIIQISRMKRKTREGEIAQQKRQKCNPLRPSAKSPGFIK